MKKVYMVMSWNPWDCKDSYLKVFSNRIDACEFVVNYDINVNKEEELEIIEVDQGEVSVKNKDITNNVEIVYYDSMLDQLLVLESDIESVSSCLIAMCRSNKHTYIDTLNN